mgnify:FL=1
MSDDGDAPLCPLCQRPIPPNVPQSRHHLIPRLKGGKGGPTVVVHHICHREIHATLTEAELARSYSDIDALRNHPHLKTFIRWVRRRTVDFQSKIPGKRRKR